MNKTTLIKYSPGVLAVFAFSFFFVSYDSDAARMRQTPEQPLPKQVNLAVPYTSQAPDGRWVSPWNKACEEAVATMIDFFYQDKPSIPRQEARVSMQRMFSWEDETFGFNDDTDAEQTRAFITYTTSFVASVKRNPTVDDIKRELAEGRPVIALLNRHDLYTGKKTGTKGFSYHVIVIHGYSEGSREFFLLDPARQSLKRATYDRLMATLGDYDAKTGEVGGTPTVLFTREQEIEAADNSVWDW